MRNVHLLPIVLLLAGSVGAQPVARYLANAGVLVSDGETKIAFDPLFNEGFGQYQLLPRDMKEALLSGAPPFDGLDAVLVSHYHDDHFSPEDILRLLNGQAGIHLFAPSQAVSAVAAIAAAEDEPVFRQITAIDLQYGQSPAIAKIGDLTVEAVRIPHTGWPDSMAEVENIAFVVTLDQDTTVIHLGDADTRVLHFAQDAEFWADRSIWRFPRIGISRPRMAVGYSATT